MIKSLTHQEWLIDYQRTIVLDSSGFSVRPHHSFPSSVVSFLREVLSSNPSLAHAILSAIQCPSNHQLISTNNETVQLLYVECIEDSIKQLHTMLGKGDEHSDSQYESDVAPQGGTPRVGDFEERRQELVESIYSMLSLLDPTPNMSQVMRRLQEILGHLLKFDGKDSTKDRLCFTREEIYSCFVGRKSSLLIRRLQELEDFQRTLGGASGSDDGRRKEEQDEAQKWSSVFYSAIQDRKHFLESVMVSARVG